MFDFEQLSVYQKTIKLNKKVFAFMRRFPLIDQFLQKQLKRTLASVASNIAEGVGRFTVPDRRHFYIIARGSAFEAYAHLDIIAEVCTIDSNEFSELKRDLEEVSKMLFGLIQKTDIKHCFKSRT